MAFAIYCFFFFTYFSFSALRIIFRLYIWLNNFIFFCIFIDFWTRSDRTHWRWRMQIRSMDGAGSDFRLQNRFKGKVFTFRQKGIGKVEVRRKERSIKILNFNLRLLVWTWNKLGWKSFGKWYKKLISRRLCRSVCPKARPKWRATVRDPAETWKTIILWTKAPKEFLWLRSVREIRRIPTR